jgi:hypothetical protein
MIVLRKIYGPVEGKDFDGCDTKINYIFFLKKQT